VSLKLKSIVFSALIVGSFGFLSWAIGQDPRESLRTAAFVVPLVVLTQWFVSRFSGRRRRAAFIAVYSALGAMVASAYAVWEFTLFWVGYDERRNSVEAAVAGAIFVVCSLVSVWSLLSLRKSAATN